MIIMFLLDHIKKKQQRKTIKKKPRLLGIDNTNRQGKIQTVHCIEMTFLIYHIYVKGIL
jgi:hypothetical protein